MSQSEDRLAPLPGNPKVAAIVDRLISAIAAGDFLPGTRLPSERSLAESLAVGRNTVRSALQELATTGWIETRRGRHGGAYVVHGGDGSSREAVTRVFGTEPEEWETMIDAIALGYSLAAEAAAMRRDDDDLTTIAEALAAFRAAVDDDDPQRAQIADGRFHHAIIDAAKQPMLHGIIRDLDRRISLGAPLHIWGSDDQHAPMQQRALRDHTEIVGAIRRQDRTSAFDLSYQHAQIDLDLIRELLQE